MFQDPNLSDTDVADLVKLYKYLQPSRTYDLGPRLLTTDVADAHEQNNSER
jgi:hypothetical protein